MKVTSPADYSHVTPLDRGVEQGETVDVSDELGAQLIEQGWTAEKAKGGPVGKAGTVGPPSDSAHGTESPEPITPAPEAPSEEDN